MRGEEGRAKVIGRGMYEKEREILEKNMSVVVD